MVRAPCCEKMGLKKGPWTTEEDEILVSYIKRYGHDNWRALPKQAGLLRCGKSCRLRWINYLRPDIKRGNFSSEEEEIIIKLHQVIGNRWSGIAARLPGRTDNEIKNYWHTHLKKRLLQENSAASTANGQSCTRTTKGVSLMNHAMRSQPVPVNFTANFGRPSSCHAPSFLHHQQEYPCQEEVLNSMAEMEAINWFDNTGDHMRFWYNLSVKAGSSSSSEIFENVVRIGQQENPNPH